MAAAGPQKQKRRSSGPDASANAEKKARLDGPKQALVPLSLTAHDAILAELGAEYDVLTGSVISSTKINKRVTRALGHIRGEKSDATDTRAGVVLLHARPREVTKMITIAEHIKRDISREGGKWYQYNRMYILPQSTTPGEDHAAASDEGAAEEASDSESDDFEVMASRFQNAVLPSSSPRSPMSLSIFLSCRPIPAFRAKSDITLQTNDETLGRK